MRLLVCECMYVCEVIGPCVCECVHLFVKKEKKKEKTVVGSSQNDGL